MPLQFIFGSSGVGKSHRLYQQVIRESMAHPDDLFMVLVPEQFTMQTQKELALLHPDGGILNIDVLSFQRLAYRIFEETGTAVGSVLEETGKNLVLRKLTQEHKDELKVLGGGLKKMGYISEIKSLVSELTQYAVSEQELERVIQDSQDQPHLYWKLKDLQVLYRAFHAYLQDRYITAEELLEVLCGVVDQSERIRRSVIVLDGFTGFTPIQNQLLQKLMGLARRVVVTVTIDPREDPYRLDGEHQLFYLSKKTVTTLMRLADEVKVPVEKPQWIEAGQGRFPADSALGWLEQNLFRPGERCYDGSEGGPKLNLLRNPEAEVHWAAAKLTSLLREKGYHYRDFAVITGNMEEYAPILERVFAQYQIPCFLDYKRSILQNPLVEFIRSLFELAEQDFSYASVFRYLRSGLSGMAPEDADILENYVLALGVRGAKRWNEPFVRTYGTLTPEELEYVNGLREQTAERLLPFVKIQRKKKVTIQERTVALYELITACGIQNRLAVYEKRFEQEGNLVLAREYHQIYGIVMDLLDKLVDLLGEETLPLREYTQLLDAGFAELKVGVIPPGADEVVAGDMERTRLKDVKVLFFLGVNEGSVPKSASRAGLLSEMEREKLKKDGMELAPTSREQSYIQRFYLYLSLTKPSEGLYVSCTMLDGAGKTLRPSYLISLLLRMFPKMELSQPRESGPVPQNDREGIRTLIEGLKTCRQGERDAHFVELLRWYRGQENYADKLRTLLDAAFSQHTDTALGRAVAHALYGTTLTYSVTRLEQYAKCAYAHFLSYGLRLQEREQYEFQTRDMGTIFHEVLQAFSERLEKSEWTWRTLPQETADAWIEECLKTLTVDYGNSILGSSARNAYMLNRMQRILKRTVWALKEQIRQGLFLPENYEISFGSVSELSAVNITLSPEERLRLQGRIDRVDTCEDEGQIYVKVIDYKSGGTTFQLLSIYHGLQLQLVVYLNAAMELVSRNHPDSQVHPAGILYYHLDDPLLDQKDGETEEELNRRILEKLKPNGLVNADPEIVKRLDQAMPGRSSVLPLSYNKDGSLSAASHVATEEQFRQLTGYVSRKMQQMGVEILEGHAEVSPYVLKDESACVYCPYHGVCGLDPKDGGYRVRRLKQWSDDEIWAKLGEEGQES